MIEIKDVSKSYNGTIKAVDNLNLSIPDGQIVGFLGPNGAGKTTTLKMLTGALNPDSGSITVNGINLENDPIAVKSRIGFIPDSPDMFLRLTGLEYLNFIADIYGVKASERAERIEKAARDFEIIDVLKNKLQSYSHGMRQKIIFIGALIHNPDVWILDEPMTGLDPRSSFLLKETLREEASRNKIVFFSTHILEVAEKLCDRVAIINKGKLQFYGKIEEMRSSLKADDSLEQMFLEMTDNE